MGTALTPEQAAKLRRLAPAVVVCYDGDSAGRAATRGALSHLLAEGFSARVVRLPPGRDPARRPARARGPRSLAARIEEAPDYLTWLLEDANPQEAGLSSAEKSGRVVGDRRDPRRHPRHDPPPRGVPAPRQALGRPAGAPLGPDQARCRPLRPTAARPPLGTREPSRCYP